MPAIDAVYPCDICGRPGEPRAQGDMPTPGMTLAEAAEVMSGFVLCDTCYRIYNQWRNQYPYMEK